MLEGGGMKTPYPVLEIANWFVEKGTKTKNPVTPIRLMSLIYFSHGWFLALDLGKDVACNSLIDCTIEAWSFGPTQPDVYHTFKHHLNKPIKKPGQIHTKTKTITPTPQNHPTLHNLLNKIWSEYSHLTTDHFISMTMGKGTPWYNEWHHNGAKFLKYKDIPNDAIKSHFQQFQ
jgi:uncharacterized phage-associated protein